MINTQSSIPGNSSPQPQADDGLTVFVYGTLQPGECNYSVYCDGHVIDHYGAIAYGTLFDLPFGYPAMTKGAHPVYGSVLHLDSMATLDTLDELEDYNPTRPPEENEYVRQRIEIFDTQGHSLGYAWAYLMDVDKALEFGGHIISQGKWSRCVSQNQISPK